MRLLRWIAALTALCIMVVVLPVSFAEDVICEQVEEAVAEAEVFDLGDDNTEEAWPEEAPAPIADEVQEVKASTASDFEIKDGVLVKYTGVDNNVVIPRGVTEIGDFIFSSDKNVESVTIPDTVTRIGDYAFSECEALKDINLPDSISQIGRSAFSWCYSLKEIKLPQSISSLEEYVFCGCDSLTEVTIPTEVSSINDGAFSFCDNLKIVVIQSGVTDIGESFTGCNALESITIPSSVNKIARTAFNNSNNVVIRGDAGSYAQQYAQSLGLPFNAPIVSFDEKEFWVRVNKNLTLTANQNPSDLATTLTWSSSNTDVATVDQTGTVTGVGTGEAIITAAPASGRGKTGQITVHVPQVTSITTYPEESARLTVGELQWMESVSWIDASYYLNDSLPVTWTSSDSSVVSIERSEQISDTKSHAYVRALKTGTATITASTEDSGIATILITVDLPEPDSVSIDQSGPLALSPGETFPLSATIFPSEAVSLLNWYSYDTNVVTVDGSGLVTAVGPGSTRISVSTENYKTDGIYVNVGEYADLSPTQAGPTEIQLNKTKATLGVKEKLSLKATLLPSGNAASLSFHSSNTGVATVSSKGVVTAKKVGSATITAVAGNGVTASAQITVKPAPKKVTLNKKTATLKKGKKLSLKAKLTKGSASALTWKSSNPKVAKVNSKGKVTALKKGKATITVKTFNGKTAKIKITVK